MLDSARSMASILVVCTGNICRSPMAEGFLRRSLASREAIGIGLSSAGISGWGGSRAMPESVEAAAERGADISAHLARRLDPQMLEAADLLLGMSVEHRDAAVALAPSVASRAFTLKELVRLVEALPPVDRVATDSGQVLLERVDAAEALRRSGFAGNPLDDDVVDPLGLPLDSYRAVAWELDEWCDRLVDGLIGKKQAPAPMWSAEG
jgi:low molecular weight protein-tyrosine phosphatase